MSSFLPTPSIPAGPQDDGTLVSAPSVCNASTEELISRITGNAKVRQVDYLSVTEKCTLPECPNPLPPAGFGSPQRHKFCSKKCGTLARVRSHRAKNAPLTNLKRRVVRDYHDEQRLTSVAVREVGYDMNHAMALAEKHRCKQDCKTYRAETKILRDELKRQNKALTLQLNTQVSARVAKCDEEIHRLSEIRTPMNK